MEDPINPNGLSFNPVKDKIIPHHKDTETFLPQESVARNNAG